MVITLLWRNRQRRAQVLFADDNYHNNNARVIIVYCAGGDDCQPSASEGTDRPCVMWNVEFGWPRLHRRDGLQNVSPCHGCTLAHCQTPVSASTPPPSRVMLSHAFFYVVIIILVIYFTIGRYKNRGSISHPAPTHLITPSFLSFPRHTTNRQTRIFCIF